MRKVGLFLIILAVACFLIGSIWAETVTVTAKAQITNNAPEIDVTILKFTDGNPDNNPWTNSTDVTATGELNFGTLVHEINGVDVGSWFSDAGFCVILYSQSFGHPYQITSTCTGITSASGSLPANSFGLTPVYSDNDQWCYGNPQVCVAQGAMPGTATLGSDGSAVATDKLIYSSESPVGTPRILQAYYGLPPYEDGGGDPFTGYVPIPLTQPADNYSGGVQITISAI